MGQGIEIRVPDIGDFEDVEVVEILVSKGDEIAVDQSLVSIESDKATMEIPAPRAGRVSELRVAEGDRVSEGDVILLLEPSEEAAASAAAPAETPPADEVPAEAEPEEAEVVEEVAAPSAPAAADREGAASARPTAAPHADATRERTLSPAAAHPVPDRPDIPHASPLVRRFARDLGVPLDGADGSGAHGRILVEDVKRVVRDRFEGAGPAGPAAGFPAAIPSVPVPDFSAFGPVHEQPLTRIQKVSGPALHRSWLNVPHVTQHDEADITELERFRRARRDEARERGLKLSPLLFVMKAVAVALRAHPALRSSLAPEGDRLIVKDYTHLGVAVDTEQGLVVPVVRDVDRKGVYELAAELATTSERARAGKLSPEDLRGACFTISSLGGIGGTAFSPIVNAPEVAILGLSRTRVAPVWRGPSPLDRPESPVAAAGSSADPGSGGAHADTGRFEPRLVLPLSLSYDHRVIDGAEAVRFTTRLAGVLSDPMQLLL